MNIRGLTELTGVAERQIRFLIAEGFAPPPRGGRSNADYGEDHATAIIRYTRLRDIGFPPAAIKLLLDAGEGAPFPVEPGITLVIKPELLGSGKDVDPIIHRITELLNTLLEEPRHVEADEPANG